MFNKRPLTAVVPLFILLISPTILPAQQDSDLQRVLQRLDRLEEENHKLADEVHALRSELAASRGQTVEGPQPAQTPPVEERVQVAEQRVADLSQEKVQTSQRFPISLTGMVLFNAFLNGKNSGGYENPPMAAATSGDRSNGASVAQTILGFRYQSPEALWGAKVNGSLFFDFWGGDGTSLGHIARLRTANIQLDWTNTSVMVGQDKPLIAPRDPFSLAQVEVSAFTDAGNLWLWRPQVRIEERFKFDGNTGLRTQLSLYQLSETTENSTQPAAYPSPDSGPALEARLEFWHRFGEHTRVEIAPDFHIAHATENGFSIPSRLIGVDWFANPWEKLEFSGTYYSGENLAGLGTIGPGYFVSASTPLRSVQAAGGWAQLAWLATPKLTFHLIAGQHDNQKSEVYEGYIYKNQGYAANLVYRLAPNVLLSLEGMQLRTSYVGSGTRLNNHYDLGVAYLF